MDTLKTYLQYFTYNLIKKIKLKKISNEIDKEIIYNLNKSGFYVINDYYTIDQIQNFTHELIKNFKEFSHKIKKFDDERFMGIENYSNLISSFSEDEYTNRISNIINNEITRCVFTMGNILDSKRLNGSSGNGWHRDSFVSQFKSMLYLTDVDENNGPLEIIPKSHLFKNVILLTKKKILKFNQFRIADNLIEKIEIILNQKRKKIIGKSGSLLLFNSTLIHRGSPIKTGKRIALTNYYYPYNRSKKSIFKQFNIS